MSNRTKILLSTIVTLLPGVALAAGFQEVGTQIGALTDIITGILPRLFFGLALVYFFYGLGSYVMGVDDKKKAEAKTTIIYGVIVLFVMASIWGLVGFLQSATGVGSGTTAPVPRIGN